MGVLLIGMATVRRSIQNRGEVTFVVLAALAHFHRNPRLILRRLFDMIDDKDVDLRFAARHLQAELVI
jgi:hypothetical protein